MKVHEKYKTFDVEWIANPNVDWDTKRLKYFIQGVIGGGTPSTGDAEYWRGDIPWVSSKDMKTNIIRDTEEHISERAVEESSTSRVEPGTVLMVARSGILKHTLPVAITAVPLTINQDIKAFTPEVTLLPRFLFWRLKGTESDILDICGKVGATVESIDIEALLSLPVSIPGLEEQTAIADYLDRETAKLDELVEKKKRLIELLKEERLAIINHAVTRGLDRNAKLRPSNIEFLGDIPKHWEIKKLRYLGLCQNGISAGAEYFGSGFPFVSYGDVYKNEALPFSVSGLANSPSNDRIVYSVRKGDVLFTRTSETIDEIGIASTCLKTITDATFSGFVIRFRPDPGRLFDEFSKYYFRSEFHRRFFEKEMNLVTRASLSQELLKRLHVLLPPMKEQKEIAAWLGSKTQKIDETIVKAEKEICLLNEYRTALISEVVTGKLRVI